MYEAADMAGCFSLRVIDADGRVVATRRERNHIVKTGRNLVARLFVESPGAVVAGVSHIGVGVDGTEPADDQTDLISPRTGRTPFSVDFLDVEEPDGSKRQLVRLTAEFGFDDANHPSVPLREAGIFNSEEGGTMYNRVVFDGVTKTDAVKLMLQWDITF